MRKAIIVLIPKSGKDPRQPASYRPISLLQVDIKVLAKILANRINQVILSLIHAEQAGFMPGRNTSFNLRRLYINLQALHDESGSRVVVALDTAKAFDSIEWKYLWKCLECSRFWPRAIKWIKFLYQDPQTRVVADGWPSPAFSWHGVRNRGARCPHYYMHWQQSPLQSPYGKTQTLEVLAWVTWPKRSICTLMTLCCT